MKELLLTYTGRINRQKFWYGLLLQFLIGIAIMIATALLWMVIPGQIKPDGTFSVEGAKAIPYVILSLGYGVFSFWSGLCLSIKRYHDRNKSGWWLLILLVPVIGSIWYFIETACLSGTAGPNAYGPDPLKTA